MRSFSLLRPFCHAGSRTLTGLLLGTVSTLGFVQEAQAASDTQAISGSFTGAAINQVYDGPVSVDGLLTLKNGAKLTAPEMIAGPGPDGSALVTVTGSGSALSTGGNLIVGAAPEAYIGTTLTMASGGAVTAGNIIAGQGDGTLGTLNVTANNSGDTTRLTTNNLFLGTEGGNAALNVTGQGTGVATVHVDGQLVVGKPDAIDGLGANTVYIAGGGVLEVGGTNGIQVSGNKSDYTFTLAGGTLRAIGADLTTDANITLGRTTGTSILDTGSFDMRLSGTVTGSSNLTKTGSGTLTMTGDTQYAHGVGSPPNTFIREGTLAASPLSLRGVGTIQNDSTLLIDRALYTGSLTTWPDMVFNTITGTGQLVKAGSATITLTTDNSYTGATVVREGVLQLGTGGKTGSIGKTSGIELLDPSSNLTVYHSNDLTITSPITGAGSVFQKGSGNLTLSGINSYTGGTQVQAGTLTGTTQSFGSGAIGTASGTTLSLNQSTAGVLANTVSGDGQLVKQGSGNVTLAAANSYTGGTQVQAGTLTGTTQSFGNGAIGTASGTTLSLNQSTDGVLVNTVSGDGQLVKQGSGNVTLAAANSYTGGTQIQAGTLTGTTQSFGNGAIGATAGATLSLNQSADGVLANTVSGDGQLVKQGSSNVTLGVINNYTGGTQVQAGTLRGTTQSFGSGAIGTASGTTLSLNQSTDGVLANMVSGDGQLVTQGSGTVTLTGFNSYTGGTSIQMGTLAGSAQGFGTGAVDAAAGTSLLINSGGTFHNSLVGEGRFVKVGQDALSYTGDGAAFTGNTDVRQGTLSVDGDLQHSTVTVENSAALSGTGLIGNAVVQGVFAPGSGAFDALHVAGNVSMQGGSTLAVNVGSDLQSSQALVAGAFAIAPGATLAVTAQDGAALSVGQHYTLVQAQGGVTGQFAQYDQTGLVNTHSLLLMTQPAYTADEVQLVLARNTSRSFGYGSTTRNQQAAGYGLDGVAVTAGGLALTDTVAGLSDQQRYRALNALSGEINASAKAAMINDAFYIRDAALNRLDCADDVLRQTGADEKSGACRTANGHRLSVWGTVYGAKGQNSGTASAARLSNSSVGWIMGADTRLSEWRVGGLLAYGRSMFSSGEGRNASGHSNNATLGAYGGTDWRVGGLTPDARVTLKLGADYTWNVMDIRRTVQMPGYQSRTNSSPLGGTGQVYGESGYRIVVKAARTPVELEPFVRMTYLNYQADGFHEHGGAALKVQGMDQSLGYSTFGLKAATSLRWGSMVVIPNTMLAYRHAFGMTNTTARENFAGLQGYSMDVAGTPIATDAAVLKAGLSAKLADRVNVSVDYIGQYGNHLTTSGGSGTVSYRW
ncbi:autotransporter-associated beta strand repeat-containing protein [Gluconobacter frateurii]|uniref:autotransporter-associated beta strand repeat-containing protein n=1 Tax=Gluconobacter frateurii TaxID=38308 RepID=UPI001F05064E|nr:autotransporter-associated beta strand repeat-containing protein [Gluconobacter frateurii]UMM09014.1 autotransporter-associated beta strand repeat-containing protein [Gluconobacter frateurii]